MARVLIESDTNNGNGGDNRYQTRRPFKIIGVTGYGIFVIRGLNDQA